MTRYKNLREAVQLLASPAAVQVSWLDDLFSDVTDGGSSEAFGNDELALEFGDIALACGHMVECGEMSEAEKGIVGLLDELLTTISDASDDTFWQRNALYEDARWEELRACAKSTLSKLPDEARESDWTRKNWGGGNSKAIPSA